MKELKELYYYLREEGFQKEASFLFSLYKTAEVYTIKSGDSPYKLSGGDPKFQRLIEDANKDITDWTKIQIGQKINMPKKPSYPNSNVNFSESALSIIRKFETQGMTQKQFYYGYNDVGMEAYGYGHRTGRPWSSEVEAEINARFKKKQPQVSNSQASKLLQNDANIAVKYIRRNIFTKLNQHQVDALVSIIYNTGTGTFHKSDIRKIINSGDLILAGRKIPQSFNTGAHDNRRYAEAILFQGGTI